MVNLASLQNLTRLTSLSLWQNGITNVSPLVGLTNLSCLDLRWNSITNFASALTGLTNLTSLYLGGNSISNVPPLQSLKQLTLLNLDDNRITDLSPLTNLTSLNYLAVNRNTNCLLLRSLQFARWSTWSYGAIPSATWPFCPV